jgi:5'-nucleotidase
MHIVVTNDDGIDSPGLWALAGALQAAGLGTVTIVAPEEEQSGTSMGLPPRRSHTVRPVAAAEPAHAHIAAYAYSGTPAGCVTVALLAGICPRPDVVVSGINRGLNSGTNVLLSGTVGAAMIAALAGLPALAVSLQFVGDAPMPWATAAWAAAQIFPLLERTRERGPTVLNVNVPHRHSIAELRGFRQTRLSNFFYGDYLSIASDPPADDGRRELRFVFRREQIPSFPLDSDDGAVRAGYVTLTALTPLSGPSDLDLGSELAALGPQGAE